MEVNRFGSLHINTGEVNKASLQNQIRYEMKPPGFCFGRLMKIPKSNEPKIQELLGETQEELYFVASLYKSYCLDLRSVHIWDNLIITQLVVLTFLHIESSCFQDVLSLPSTLAFDYTSSDELLSHFLLFLPFQRGEPFFFFQQFFYDQCSCHTCIFYLLWYFTANLWKRFYYLQFF